MARDHIWIREGLGTIHRWDMGTINRWDLGTISSRGIGSIKRLGGTGFQGHFWILKRGPKKLFPANVGGRKENVLIILYRNFTFLTKLFLKTSKFPNKEGTFDVNLDFTATVACTKRALFIKKALLVL
jgi:hypothetical protein